MEKSRRNGALAPALLLLSCEQAQAPNSKPESVEREPSPNAMTAPQTDTRILAEPGVPAANRADDGYPDLSPPKLTPEAERFEAGARNVLLSFARAIELHEYRQAWSMLSTNDQKKWSEEKFAAIFRDLIKTTVIVPPGELSGAAGTIYYATQISVTGADVEGRPVRLEGEAILSRLNDVEGASVEQLRWHFRTLELDWTH